MTRSGNPSRRSKPPSRRRPPPSSGRSRRLLVGVVAALVVGSLVASLLAGGGGTGDDAGSGDGSEAPNAVAAVLGVGDDPAIGRALPTLGGEAGEDIDGNPMTIAATGRPQVIVFLAHWCPHCRAEVPRVQDWLDGGGPPAGVDLVAVATANDPNRPNHPASDWLHSEGWTLPTLLDESGDAARAAGVDAFPYWVFVDGSGTILARTSGELPVDQLAEAMRAMADAAA